MESNPEKDNRASNTDKKRRIFPFRVDPSVYLWIVGVFTLVGVTGGYLYYHFIGCDSGGCAITSNPYMSMVWGGVLGFLIPDFIVKKKKQG